MKASTKKEVSCKAFDTIFSYARQKNIKLDSLVAGVPYELSYLLNKHERVEWWVWCKVISNSRHYFQLPEYEEMGRSFVSRGSYWEGILWSFFLFTSSKFSRLLYNQIFKIGESMFSCIKHHTDFIASNRFIAEAYLEEGYEFCPEWSLMCKGVWEQLGSKIGQRGFKVDMNIKDKKTIFNVSWIQESILFKVKTSLKWLFNIRKALLEITDSRDAILNQYQELEASQKILQKQTTQLKTAYEISTSIRQTVSIEETLKAIVNALVKEAGFTFASIRLFNDLYENKISIGSQAGIESEIPSPVKNQIKIYNVVIGELTIHPNSDIDYRDCNELLDYLTPVINITIHDALVLREVSDYKDNLEQKVAQRTSELQKARETQNQFFTNISHEFRTPLTLILGPAKQLKSQINDEQIKEQLDLIYRNAAKLNRLVDELLDIARIESGEMKLKACPVDLVSIVRELAFSFSSLAERKKIAFIMNQNNEKIAAYIDKAKFDKILTNVLSNAFKFTPEGGKVEVSINVRTGPVSPSSSHPEIPKLIRNYKNGFVEISISDTGTGIPQNQKDKIFDRFYQVDGSHTREHGGTGIGLSLTKELIELHKGEIEVDTKEGKGTTFRLIFPLGKDHLKPEEICEEEKNGIARPDPESDESAEVTYPHKIDIEFSKKPELPTLLVVEDNPDVRKYIQIIFQHQYTIIEAEDGEAGLSKSIECLPDLIISDIMMPKMDGFRLCCKLKSDTRTSHIPVIMLTAKATMQDKLSGLETGADDYIMKPFEAAELKSRVKNLLEQRKRLHEHFRKYGLTDVDEKNITPVDQKFLQKAIDIISKHISNTTFGVEVLAENLAVSKSLLLKKTEALFGESPSDLIRRIRLNKAAGLIERDYGNISEIAFEVGFSNPSYFAECFRKQFGVAPSQYLKNR